MIDLSDCNEDERMIMELTNCYNLELIRAALVEYQYNTDLAIEYIMNTVTKPNNEIKNSSARNVSPSKQQNNAATSGRKNTANNNNEENSANNNTEGDTNNHSRNPYHGKKKGGKVQSLSDPHDAPIHPKLAKFA